MVINEQIRLYNEKMEEIEQLEYAEALAVNQLKLKRQNTVTHETLADTERPFVQTTAKTCFTVLFSLVPGEKYDLLNNVL